MPRTFKGLFKRNNGALTRNYSVIVILFGVLTLWRNSDRNVDANFQNGEKRDQEVCQGILTIKDKDMQIRVYFRTYIDA